MSKLVRLMERHTEWLVILDTMWGTRPGKAINWFPINPENHSGKRLFQLTQCQNPLGIWVTNACPQCTDHATKHGKPDPVWLYGNLMTLSEFLRKRPLLVCGGVAQKTLKAITDPVYHHKGVVLELAHPAARNWTGEKLLKTKRILEGVK